MLRDVLSFEHVWRRLHKNSKSTPIVSFVRFLEKKLGVEVVYDAHNFPHEGNLSEIFELAEKLRAAGVIRSYFRSEDMPDEPHIPLWGARFRDTEEECFSGGSALDDNRHALTCTLAEGLERHLWFEKTDYFKNPIVGTVKEVSKKYPLIVPEQFAGLAEEQREHIHLRTSPESQYFWIQGQSLLESGKPLWLPAQVITGNRPFRTNARERHEPFIRYSTTNGLSTHPNRMEALLLGALEVIERDAYMIMWLNQISPARIDVEELSTRRDSLKKLLEICRRYRLKPHILRMPTDAPTYALCALVEDETGHAPRIAVGLKAHRDPAYAAEKAITEALRARRGARRSVRSEKKNIERAEVGHYGRIEYWATGDNYKKLFFLIQGPIQHALKEAWESDTPAEHLARIISWCREKGYACATVPFTKSKTNVTPWHIEFVVIPELQPMYFTEKVPHTSGARLTEIPKLLGYTSRTPLFTEEPHPFA